MELKPFEEDVLKLLENIKFRDNKNHFQETLANDLKKTNLSDKIFVFADKTRNIYETSLDTYNKLLHDNITKTCKHGSEDNISGINNEFKHIANKLSIGNRIEWELFEGNYLRNLIEKVESVLKRMRWKAHFFLKGEKNHENTNHFWN